MSRPKRYQPVICVDGFKMSVQASYTSYCQPRIDEAERYSEVEIGYPTAKEELLMNWCEDPADPTGTVYGYVPVQVVVNVIAKHGGMVEGELPPGIAPLRASSR
jgi:hypothetical protein